MDRWYVHRNCFPYMTSHIFHPRCDDHHDEISSSSDWYELSDHVISYVGMLMEGGANILRCGCSEILAAPITIELILEMEGDQGDQEAQGVHVQEGGEHLISREREVENYH
jgi:hypothetical protein